MGSRRDVWDGRPVGDFRNGLVREGKYPCQVGVLAAGNQNRCGLLFQRGDGNLLASKLTGCVNGGVQAPQVHVRRNHKGVPLKQSVPGGDLRRRRPVLILEGGLRQPLPVVWYGHDLKLHRPGAVAGEQMDRELKALIGASVGNQLGVGLGIGLQFGQDIPVAFPGKEEDPLCVGKPGRLVGEGGQLIRQGQLADAGTDTVDGTEQVSQMSNRRHAGAAPGIGPPAARDSG